MRIVGEAAWRSCRQLQVVHLPDTVVSLLHGAFSRCRVLRAVIAPGCQHFGAKVFDADFLQRGTFEKGFLFNDS